MESKGFIFADVQDPSPNEFVAPHEAQPLRLAELVNRGRPRASDAAAHLRSSTFDNRKTLDELMSMINAFGMPVCLEGSRYVIHFCK